MVDVLPDDHVETAVLREHARGKICAVIGAFKGATMIYLLDHGAQHVIGVEPQQWAADEAVKKLIARGAQGGMWEVDTLALVPWETTPDSVVWLYNVGMDGANILGVHRWLTEKDSQEVRAMCIAEWLDAWDEQGGTVPEFVVLNVEGAEYMLLPYLLTRVSHVLVQFHGPPIPDTMTIGHRRFVGKNWYLYS